MPSTSRAQKNLMRAAEHGAEFPMARAIRHSMTPTQIHDFAAGSNRGLPAHASKHPHRNLGHYLHPKKHR